MATMANNLITTGIGSLNHKNIEDAISYSLKHDLPFLPQLPHLNGNMIEEISLQGNCIEDSFLTVCLNNSINKIKIQIVGPTSSSLSTNKLLNKLIQTKKKFTNFSIVLFIDEPVLTHSIELENLVKTAKIYFDKVGLHCCANKIDTDVVNKLNLDIFSYDYLLNNNIHNFLDESIELAVGIVDTKSPKLISNIDILKDERVKYLSATCGLADERINPNLILDILNSIKKGP